MRKRPVKHLESCRIRTGPLASDESSGMNGGFVTRSPNGGYLVIVLSDGGGWDHASVEWRPQSGEPWNNGRCPTWDEMRYVQQMCFTDEEWAIQYMVPGSVNINVHPHVLHMWRPQGVEIPKPPRNFV